MSWELSQRSKRGLPDNLARAFDANELTRGASLLMGFPEHKVAIEGGGHASQNDLWALVRLANGTASMSVEAKSGEPFDKLVADWLHDAPINSKKPQRLNSLQKTLGIEKANLDGIRYQLLHRTASALIEAERFNTTAAIMIVQSFGGSADEDSYKDFTKFRDLMQNKADRGSIVSIRPYRIEGKKL